MYFTVQEAGCLRSDRGGVAPESCRGRLFQVAPVVPGGLLTLLGVPRLAAASPHSCLDVHMAFFLCAYVCVQISPFYKRNSHIG